MATKNLNIRIEDTDEGRVLIEVQLRPDYAVGTVVKRELTDKDMQRVKDFLQKVINS